MAARSSSTRSASLTRACRSSCSGFSSLERSAAWARTSPSGSTSACSAPPTAIFATWSKNELFREDLFFRLNTFEIFLPALRDRKADIAELARHLLTRYAARRGMTESSFSPESLEMLAAHDWPGNIRELANVIERATILAGNGPIRAEHLPTQFPARGRTQHSAAAHPPIAAPHFTIPEGTPTLRDIEMSYIQAILEKHNGNKPAASKELGISLKTLYNKINQLQQN